MCATLFSILGEARFEGETEVASDLEAVTIRLPQIRQRSAFSEVSHQAYITHVSMADLGEALTRRSSANVGVSYSLTNYLGNGESSFDSRQASAIAGFYHQLGRRDSVGISYQAFQNPCNFLTAVRAISSQIRRCSYFTEQSLREWTSWSVPASELVTTGGGKGPELRS